MKRLGVVLGVAVVVAALAASAEAASFKGQTLRVQFWGGNDGLVI